jgi:hypothetical protein
MSFGEVFAGIFRRYDEWEAVALEARHEEKEKNIVAKKRKAERKAEMEEGTDLEADLPGDGHASNGR